MKVALYARVSTDDKGQDPENQLYRMRNIAEGRGFTIVKEYVDFASGKSLNRPGIQQMMLDVRRHSFDAVMIVKVDRLSRDVIDAIQTLETLRAAGVSLVITEEGIDTTTAWGKAIFNIIATLAELDRSNISERTKMGLQRTVAQGTVLGRPTKELSPYQLDKARQLIRDDPTISQERLAAEFNGISRNTLIKELRKEGIL